jgi:hypothetical protein
MSRSRNGSKRPRFNYRISRGHIPTPSPGELLLEHVTDEDFFKIRQHGKSLNAYHNQLFYELEGQRAAAAAQIRSALQSIPAISVCVDGWCRQVRTRYALAPLCCVGSLQQSGRFNYAKDLDSRFPRFPSLYIAEDRATAHCEMFQISGREPFNFSVAEMNFQPEASIAAYSLRGQVAQVFDLTKEDNLLPFLEATQGFTISADLRKLEKAWGIGTRSVASTPTQLISTFMDKAWRAFPMYADIPANSQVFGRLLMDAGFEGVLYRSVRQEGGRALAIFTRNLAQSSTYVQVHDAPPHAKHTRVSKENYLALEEP